MQGRWIAGIVTAGALMALAGCGDKVLDYRNAEISNNKIYSNGEDVGFSGKVTNVPFEKLPVQQMGTFLKIVGSVTGDRGYQELLAAAALANMFGTAAPSVLCDVKTDAGGLTGKASCKTVSGNVALFDIGFKDNQLDGDAVVYHYKKDKQVVGRAHFEAGKLDGKLEVVGMNNERQVHKSHWKDGLAEGREERFDENTGKLVFEGTLKGGKYDGKASQYTPEGELIQSQVFHDGVLEPAAAPAQAAVTGTAQCEDAWMKAFRKENGEEAMISADQLSEWESWCAEGKQPGQV